MRVEPARCGTVGGTVGGPLSSHKPAEPADRVWLIESLNFATTTTSSTFSSSQHSRCHRPAHRADCHKPCSAKDSVTCGRTRGQKETCRPVVCRLPQGSRLATSIAIPPSSVLLVLRWTRLNKKILHEHRGRMAGRRPSPRDTPKRKPALFFFSSSFGLHLHIRCRAVLHHVGRRGRYRPTLHDLRVARPLVRSFRPIASW